GGAEGLNPALSSFRNRGGKLLIYHGWSDPAFSPQETIGYYNSVIQDREDLNDTVHFVRLFMVPGMQHCIGSGPGPNVFDPLSVLVDWVERNVEPKKIIAAHFQNNDPSSGEITRTMPLCPYPKTAHFKSGDVNQASNWTCLRQKQ